MFYLDAVVNIISQFRLLIGSEKCTKPISAQKGAIHSDMLLPCCVVSKLYRRPQLSSRGRIIVEAETLEL